MTTCKHCGRVIIRVEEYIWVHQDRSGTMTGDLCQPEQGFRNSTLAEPMEATA